MVLLYDVVEVVAAADDDGLPPLIFLSKQSHGLVTRDVAVHVDRPWPHSGLRGDRLLKKRLRRVATAIGAEQRIHGPALPIDRPIQVARPTADRNSRFVHSP